MKLIVGLGNPGEKYKATRHNIGRDAVSYMVEYFNSTLKKEKLTRSFCSRVDWNGQDVVLAVTDDYMNVSGECIAKLAKHFNVNSEEDLLIIVDDVALPFGKLRLRSSGSAGGHNGLRSIEACLGHASYIRLRVGINPSEESEPLPIPMKEFVLMRFTREEAENLSQIYQNVMGACNQWLDSGITSAMNAVNGSI